MQSRIYLLVTTISLLLSIVVLAGTGIRILRQYHSGGKYDALHGGMADFHNGAYYPAMAIRDGVSPYGNRFAEDYPVAKPTPLFSPSILALHVPITYLPQHVADGLYFTISVLLLALIAWLASIECYPLTQGRWLGPRLSLFSILLLLILVSRGGHTTLLNGYFTPIIVLGTQMALQLAQRSPACASLGVFLAAGKPTFAIPLGIVMLARGNYRALFWGVLFSMVGALLPLCWLAYHSSWQELFQSLQDGQKLHMVDARELPVNTWTRVDLTAIAAKWLGANPSEIFQILVMIPLMAIPSWILYRRRNIDAEGTISRSGAIGMLIMIIALYHHVYDTLILVGPIAILLATLQDRLLRMESSNKLDPPSRTTEPWNRWSIWGILVFGTILSSAWWNYASSEIILIRLPEIDWLRHALTSLNAFLLLVSLFVLCWGAVSSRKER